MANSGRETEYSSNGMYQDTTGYTPAGAFGLAICVCSWIAFFVLWILGIINAAKINSITKESAVLVVFSVLTLLIAHVITAHSQKNKYNVISGTQSIDLKVTHEFKYSPADNSYEAKKARLRQAFIDGQITLKEYETKVKALEGQETK